MEAIEKTLKTSLAKEKIKKMRIAGREKEGGEKKPSRIKLLVGVVSAGDAAEVSQLCNSVGVRSATPSKRSAPRRPPFSTIWGLAKRPSG